MESIQIKQNVSFESFKFISMIGEGNFGTVYLAEFKSNQDNMYAIKVFNKKFIVENKSEELVQIEQRVAKLEDSPSFICKLEASFQDEINLYMLFPYLGGGELLFHLQLEDRFKESRARIYLAEISMALFYLHHKGIAYRDVKPENIMLDNDGHIKLVDFGFCIENVFNGSSKAQGMYGTLEYMAPEILRNQSYDCSVDLWSLGVLAFEMLTGNQPYQADNNTELLQLILHSELFIPPILSADAKHFIRSLLQINPQDRLGYSLETGEANFRAHPFFSRIDWEKLENREIQPPFVPKLESKKSKKYFHIEKSIDESKVSGHQPNDQSIQVPSSTFEDFNFNSISFLA